MDATIRNIRKLSLATDGMGFHVADHDGNLVGVYFKDHDPVRGLELLDKLRDELQAIVLDKLVETGPEKAVTLNVASAEKIDEIASEIYGDQ